MSAVAWRRLAALVLALSACGGDEGILVSVTQDPETRTRSVDTLRFVIGVDQGDGTFLAEPQPWTFEPRRDLTERPFDLLIHDTDVATPSSIVVAVIGSAEGSDTAFGGFTAPQPFVDGKVIQRDVEIGEPGSYVTTPTGCVSWGQNRIQSRSDGDCDGDPMPSDCDDADPNRSSLLAEICGDGVDQDCSGVADDGACLLDCVAGTEGEERGCYTGPVGTSAVGTCRAGVEVCTGGLWTDCSGEVVPTVSEACNGLDDDCDGVVDEDLPSLTCGVGVCSKTVASCGTGTIAACSPIAAVATSDGDCDGQDDDCDGPIDEDCTCIRVAPTGLGGNDTTAPATPFHSIQAAIDYAAASSDRPKRVCVAAGLTCGATATYTGTVRMANGVSVIGGYAFDVDAGLSYCGNAGNRSVVILSPTDATGVTFGPGVTAPTQLDGFTVLLGAIDAAGHTAGVTVNGAQHVLLSNLTIDGDATALSTTGVEVVSGGSATLMRSNVAAGRGSTQSIAVDVVGAQVTVRENCATFDTGTGACTSWCGDAEPGIHLAREGDAGTTYGVRLVDSPGSIVERTAICNGRGSVAEGVHVEGNAAGTMIAGNHIAVDSGLLRSVGVQLGPCGGTAPWIAGNSAILAGASTSGSLIQAAIAIHAVGDCHPMIDSNLDVRAGDEGGATDVTGVSCELDSSGPSRCDVLGNTITGGGFSPSQRAVGVRCAGRSCGRIGENEILATLSSASSTFGLELVGASPFVAANVIDGGCPSGTGVGVGASDSGARIENNRISGGICSGASTYYGLIADSLTPGVELDVHSNFITAGGSETSCIAYALKIKGERPSGAFRNNIADAGLCATHHAAYEDGVGADPRVFRGNDLVPNGATLYMDEGSTSLTIDQVNQAIDMITGENIAAHPMQTLDGHLMSGSMCVDSGVEEGAPPFDMDGQARPRGAGFDIGPDEL